MKIHILVVDKDHEVSAREEVSWNQRGIGITRVESMRAAIATLCRNTFLFVSINADNITYLPLLPVMREATALPIFIVTSKFVVNDQITAVRAGADGYWALESNSEDNVSSALAMLYRYSEQRKREYKPIICRNLLIDPILHRAFVDEHELDLTPLEFRILLVLALNHGRPLSKEVIYSYAWNEDNCLDVDGVVSFHIHNLRKKLAEYTAEEYIESVWGIGFKMDGNTTPSL